MDREDMIDALALHFASAEFDDIKLGKVFQWVKFGWPKDAPLNSLTDAELRDLVDKSAEEVCMDSEEWVELKIKAAR